MNKAELIEKVAKETMGTKSDVEKIINSMVKQVKDTVKQGEDVKLVGFGTFSRTDRKARTGRNPQTGATINIPACKVPKFKPGKEFKQITNA